MNTEAENSELFGMMVRLANSAIEVLLAEEQGKPEEEIEKLRGRYKRTFAKYRKVKARVMPGREEQLEEESGIKRHYLAGKKTRGDAQPETEYEEDTKYSFPSFFPTNN